MAFMVNDIKEICESGGVLFTTDDIVELHQAITTGEIYSIEGLIDYFNAKHKCNEIVELLKKVLENGVKIVPKVNLNPITEKCEVVNSKFKLSRVPLQMGHSFFINNLVVVRLKDKDGNLTNAYNMYDDVDVKLDTLECQIPEDNINGIASVSYFAMVDD